MDLANFVNKYKNKILNIIIIIFAVMVANNIYKVQNRITQSLKQNREAEIKKNELLDNIGQLEKKVNVYKNLLNKKDISLVMNTINNIARNSGVKIISIKPAGTSDYSVYVRYPFDLIITANSYHNIGTFISNIESYTDVYIIDSINIRPVAENIEKGQIPKFNVDLKVSTVFFKE